MSKGERLVAVVSMVACWGAFALVWILAAVKAGREALPPTARAPQRPFIVALSGVAAITLALVVLVPDRIWRTLSAHSPLLTGLGVVILAASTTFTLWARLDLGEMWTLDAEILAAHQLRTEGPYRVTRHPIYTGILGMLLGSLLLVGIGRAVLLLPVGYVLVRVKIDAEETLLFTAFPDEYSEYCQRVAQLIPFTRRAREHPRLRKPGHGRRRR